MSTKRIVLTISGLAVAAAAIVGLAAAALGPLLAAPGGDLPEPARSVAGRPQIPTSTESTAAQAESTRIVAPVVEAEPIEPPPAKDPEPADGGSAEPEVPERTTGVVVIDAGHQKKADLSLEPIGPGASARKPKVQGGTSGAATGNSESSVNLQVAKKLRDELEERGVTVIMVRERQDVNVANSKRARIANEADADLFIRLHCDGNSDSGMHGLSTLVPAKNTWTGPIVAESKKAGRAIHRAAIRATGAKDRGVVARSDLSGFNWSEVPTVLVEMGFMSNRAEDRKLASSSYQQKLAEGMADGIADYIKQ